jgi:hypothetical protein
MELGLRGESMKINAGINPVGKSPLLGLPSLPIAATKHMKFCGRKLRSKNGKPKKSGTSVF